MAATYCIIGFKDYVIIDKILYRRAYKIKDSKCLFKYLSQRKIKQTQKDNQIGYFLVKNGKRKFYSLKKLRHKLIKY
jgi:hypothetical protein